MTAYRMSDLSSSLALGFYGKTNLRTVDCLCHRFLYFPTISSGLHLFSPPPSFPNMDFWVCSGHPRME